MGRYSLHIILYLLTYMSVAITYGQDVTADTSTIDSRQIDTTTLQAFYDQLEWSDTKRVLRPKPREKKDINTKERKIFKFGGSGFQILGYVLVLALIGFILYLILSRIKIDPGAQPVGYQQQHLDALEDIEEIDAHAGLREALSAGDYRQALSMHYILVLQRLTSSDRIHWEPSKTNRDYIHEMHRDPDGADFRVISQAYDLVLYGDRPFGESQYQALLPILDHLAPTTTTVTHE